MFKAKTVLNGERLKLFKKQKKRKEKRIKKGLLSIAIPIEHIVRSLCQESELSKLSKRTQNWKRGGKVTLNHR